MTRRKLSFTLPLRIYPYDLRISFGESDGELNRFLKRNSIENSEQELCTFDNDTAARCVMFDNGSAVIRMQNIPETPEDFGFLQHEICHYVMFVLLHRIKMMHNLETTEAYAYLTGYITHQIYQRVFK